MQEKDKTRRKVLIGLTSAVGLSGLPFVATPFIAAWNPSAKAKAAGAAVKLDAVSYTHLTLPTNREV